MKIKQAFYVVLYMVFVNYSCAGEDAGVAEKKFTVEIPIFDTTDLTKVDGMVNEALSNHNKIINEIIDQLSKNNLSNESKVYCIYMLGSLRATRSVSILIEKIDTEAQKIDLKTRIARWGKYPAQEALTKIGKTSAFMILEKLGKENGELRRKLMCQVIAEVEGKEIGSLRIKKLAAEETNAEIKSNLETALKLIEQ